LLPSITILKLQREMVLHKFCNKQAMEVSSKADDQNSYKLDSLVSKHPWQNGNLWRL